MWLSTQSRTVSTHTYPHLIPMPQGVSRCYRRRRNSAIMHSCIIHATATTVDMNMRQLIKDCSQRLNIFHVLYLVRVGVLAEEQTVFMGMCVSGQIVVIELVGRAIVVSAREFAPQTILLSTTFRLLTSL